jgi:hypothetical protein
MAVFIISYDLRKPDHDYEPLYEALDELKAKRIHESVWGVRTNRRADSVFEFLWEHMHNEKDRLFVIPFDKDNQDYRSKAKIKLKDL